MGTQSQTDLRSPNQQSSTFQGNSISIDSKKDSYESYSPDRVSQSSKGIVVLFFHASWCPTCRALNSDIEKSLNNIPSNLTILKTDYDKETNLKQKYGVTTQHTLVQVDQDGNLIKKWSGGSTLSSILDQLN